MGNYVLNSDITDKKSLPNSVIDAIITGWEKFIEFYCQDFFYKETGQIVYFNGNGKQIMFFPGLPNIISVTSINYIDSNGVEDLVEAADYRVKPYCVKKHISGVWVRGFKNYKMICDVGHDTTDVYGNSDEKYKPSSIVESIKILVANTLDTYYSASAGTTLISVTTGLESLSSESIGDYSYSMKAKTGTLLQSSAPTDIPIVDMLIQPYKNRRPQLMVFDSNQSDIYTGYDDESLMDVYK